MAGYRKIILLFVALGLASAVYQVFYLAREEV
jgi:hypothetical protein